MSYNECEKMYEKYFSECVGIGFFDLLIIASGIKITLLFFT